MTVISLVPGANHPVPQAQLRVEINLTPAQVNEAEVDFSAFLLTASGLVRADEDMVFYGQPAPGNGSVALTTKQPGASVFTVDLTRLATGIDKIAFTATIHENKLKFGAFQQLQLVIKDAQGQALLETTLSAIGMVESALILGELYLRQGQWKFRAIGQGFIGGLRPLAEHFGVVISEPPPIGALAATTAPTPPMTTQSKPVSLSKVTLDKARPKVSLDKKAGGFGDIRINLNWHKAVPESKTGLFGGLLGGAAAKSVDLDIGCLYELQNGTKGAVQALGDSFGSFEQPPYVKLLADDRTGAQTEGEWLQVNGQYWSDIKRLLVYAFIYQGVANWTQTDGVVSLMVPDEPPLEIRLTDGAAKHKLCAVLILENSYGALQVNREVRYFSAHPDMDKAYHWGLNWQAGRKA